MLGKVAENVPAGLAVSSPWWLPNVHAISLIAADLLPIMGCIWIGVQTAGYIYKRSKR